MPDAVESLAMYLHLARASERRKRPHVRDRLLLLGAAHATKAGLPRIAAYCRRRVLEHNPQHLVQRWPTMADALRSSEFQFFLAHLEKRFSHEHAERLLQSLAIERGRERDVYYSDEEYAAAILGISLATLDTLFPRENA